MNESKKTVIAESVTTENGVYYRYVIINEDNSRGRMSKPSYETAEGATLAGDADLKING
ncbi:MAG: hypothetical protein U0791_06820 [Gemmataceae bacterium]